MSFDVKKFWLDVGLEKGRIRAEFASRLERLRNGDKDAMQGQPDDGTSCFIVTVAGRRFGDDWKAGVCCAVNLDIAARRIVEETHELATLAQINDFRGLQERSYRAALATEAARDKHQTISVETVAPTAGRKVA
jgi:hypothetical protein